jgi:hypothetical protein
MIRRARESIIFQPVREGFPSKYAFRARFSHFSVSLTSPSGRKYITHAVKQGDSSVGAGICRIRRVPGKANSYPLRRGKGSRTLRLFCQAAVGAMGYPAPEMAHFLGATTSPVVRGAHLESLSEINKYP